MSDKVLFKMRRRLESCNSGWIALALAVMPLHCSTAFAQVVDAVAPNPGRPAQERREAAGPAPAPFAPLEGPKPPNFKAILEDKRQSFRTLLVSELRFCRSAGELTNQQGEQIAREAGVMVEEAACEAARLGLKPAQRGGIWLNTDPKPPNAVKLVRSILEKLVGEFATLEQQQRYVAECKKRDAYQRETAIHALVARLDRMLLLSSTQREQLLKLFESHWDEEWGVLNGGVMGDNEGPLPAIPESLITPYLTPGQRMAWKRFEILALDATEAYLRVVAEILEGLPSEFTASLDAAARQTEKLRAAMEKKASSEKHAR
jgi:hypothetical protein